MRVAVIAGGRSAEHDVSLRSAAAVSAALRERGHAVLWVEIDRDGNWSYDGETVTVTPGKGLLGAEVVFPVLHGPYGEDGIVQGLLECLAVPYVGSDVLASAVCIDKLIFKDLMATARLPQVSYAAVFAADWKADPDAVLNSLESLKLPVFVKPSRLGSSVGITKVGRQGQLASAIEAALKHDPRVIVEAMARGLEIECSLLEEDGQPTASSPGEIVIDNEWYDFEAKYTAGGMELVVPARISDAAATHVRELAQQAFQLAGCRGLARADFFVDGEEVLLNELNTMPGFTETSVYAKLFEAAGIGYGELVERLITGPRYE